MKKLLLILSFSFGLATTASAGFHDKKLAAAIVQNGNILHKERLEVVDGNFRTHTVFQVYVTMDMVAYKCWIRDDMNSIECFELKELGVSSKP